MRSAIDSWNATWLQSPKSDNFEYAQVHVKCLVLWIKPRKAQIVCSSEEFIKRIGVDFFIILFGVAQPLSAQPADGPIAERPPIAQEVLASVERGKAVVIKLEARGKPGQKIDFIIRRQPRYGVLEPAAGGLGVGIFKIVYKHLGDGAFDSFEYAVKSGGSPVSMAALVKVRVTEPQPILEVEPNLLDFGAIEIGETASCQFKIRNAGGGVLKGVLTVPPRLKLEGPPNYELGPGRSRTWRITFTPQREGLLREEILVQRNAYGRLTAIGEGRPLFVHAPKSVRLMHTGTVGARAAALQIRNMTDRELRVSTLGPAGWPIQFTEELILARQAAGEISLLVSGSHVEPIAGEITVKAGAQAVQVHVVAPAAPARIEFLETDRVQLVAGRGSQKAEFSVINRGGEQCLVTWTADTATIQKALSGRFDLLPGQMARVPVTIHESMRGEMRVRFESGKQTLTGIISVVEDSRSTDSAPAASSQVVAAHPSQWKNSSAASPDAPVSQTSSLTLAPEEFKQLGVIWQAFQGAEEEGVVGPRELRFERASGKGAVLSWLPSPDSKESEYRLELRVLRSGTGDKILEAEWRPLPNVVTSKKEDGRLYGELKGLQRLRMHTVRVRGKLSGGAWTRPSNPVEFFTAPTEQERFWAGVAGWGGAAGVAAGILGALAWLWHRRRTHFHAHTCIPPL